ncbi:MAG: peptidoglycan DD-metalloendopeptidase family protein [Deltaproteobacteria bacterium]|nr:peptidoglycan DD-metalloendopeptidase family protein [Deltaproteobacteria bacterium]
MRITVVLVGGPKRSTRMISVPGAAVVALGVWLGLSLVAGFLVYLSHSRGHSLVEANRDLRGELLSHEKEIEAKEADLLAHQKKIEELSQRFENIRERLSNISRLDERIRQYLGLEIRKFSPPGDSHQGGLPPGDTDALEAMPDFSSPLPVVPPEGEGLMAYASFVKEQAEELVDFLEHQEERFRNMPSILPVAGTGFWISSGFGWRRDPFTSQSAFHNGLDIAGRLNDEVIAPADGKVTDVGKERFLGKVLKLSHGNGVETVFGHLNRFAVKAGDKVKRGQVIAYMGNSGRSTGTHLHYSVIKEQRCIDPRQFIWDYDFENDSLTPYVSMNEN